jgi:hypothetical protein
MLEILQKKWSGFPVRIFLNYCKLFDPTAIWRKTLHVRKLETAKNHRKP